jgi:hypothetical protein
MVTVLASASSFGLVGASGALLLTVLCVAARAQAQQLETQPMQSGPGMVLTHVSAGQRSFAVFFGRGRHPIADCEKECDFWAWPGKYRVLVRQGEGPHDDASVALRIRHPASYAFIPANGGAQNAGLILGVAGPVIGFVGAVFTAAGAFATCSDPPPGEGCDKPTAFYIGLGALAVGGGMTAVGWPLYIHNRARFEVRDAAPPRPVARWGVVPLPHGGLSLGATLAF